MRSTETGFNISFLCGPPGTGKSFYLVRWIVRDLLPETSCRIITNLPLNVDEICEAVAKRTGRPVSEYEDRIELLDARTLACWRGPAASKTDPGPWSLFDHELAAESGESNVAGARLILDECHLYCEKEDRKSQKVWKSWLGEARHEGWAGIVFASQHPSKVGDAITKHAELNFSLTKMDRDRVKGLGIPWSDVYQIKAAIVGEYSVPIECVERHIADNKNVKGHSESFPLEAKYFPFYRSASLPGGGSVEGSIEVEKQEWQKRRLFGFTYDRDSSGKRHVRGPLLWWFLWRNWFRLAWRVAAAVAIFWAFTWGRPGIVQAFSNRVTGLSKNARLESLKKQALAKLPPGSQLPENVARRLELQAAAVVPEADRVYGEPTIATDLTEEQTKTVVEDLVEAQQALATVRAEKAQLEGQLGEAYGLQMLTPTSVTFRGGSSYNIGEEIDYGPYKGKKVIGVNMRRRNCALDDGTVIWVGRGKLHDAASPASPDTSGAGGSVVGGSSVPGNLPSVGGVGQSPNGGSGNGGFANNHGLGNAPAGVPGGNRPANGSLNSGGAIPRQSSGVNRRARATSFPSAGDSSASTWGAGPENAVPVFSGNPAGGGSGRPGASRPPSR